MQALGRSQSTKPKSTAMNSKDSGVQLSDNAQGQKGISAQEMETAYRHYHEYTKHHFSGYAPGPETLDWDDQPNPFREYTHTPTLSLRLFKQSDASNSEDKGSPPEHYQSEQRYSKEYYSKKRERVKQQNADDYAKYAFSDLLSTQQHHTPLTLDCLSFYLQFCAGLTAWKTYGLDRWSLRVVPSSGNLHPGELYLLLPKTDFCEAGLYHYNVYQHQLELINSVMANANAANLLKENEIYLIQTSVAQRELWKYGERALRYCWLDAGHQLAQCHAVANTIGWQMHPVDTSKQMVAEICGFDDGDYKNVNNSTIGQEYPEWVYKLTLAAEEADLSSDSFNARLTSSFSNKLQAKANELGSRFVLNWPQADKMAGIHAASSFPTFTCQATGSKKHLDAINIGSKSTLSATDVMLRRRSAQAYRQDAQFAQQDFSALLASLRPEASDIIPNSTQLHVLCFVHSVEGLTPGIYLFPRSNSGAALFKNALTRWQPWTEVTLDNVPFAWCMKVGNTRKAAGQLSCNQAIAANSCFTLFFLAEFDAATMNHSNHVPDVYLEAGMLGQQIYLMTTAQGYSATGIGCFFDDAIHELVGLEDTRLQVVYGFAAGEAVTDSRITQLSGYYHLLKKEEA